MIKDKEILLNLSVNSDKAKVVYYDYARDKHGLHPSRVKFLATCCYLRESLGYIHFKDIQASNGYSDKYMPHLLNFFLHNGYIVKRGKVLFYLTVKAEIVVKDIINYYGGLLKHRIQQVAYRQGRPSASGSSSGK